MKEPLKPYMINSFHKVGLPDPFQVDQEMMSTDEDIKWHSEVMADHSRYIYPESRNDPH